MGMWTLEDKLQNTSKKLEVGKAGVTNESSVGHLVIIEQLEEETVIVSEANYISGYITIRRIPKEIILGVIHR